MRRLVLLSAVGLLLLAPSGAVPAQQSAAVSAGQRVRVHWMESIRRRRAVGDVLASPADSLVLARPAGVRMFALARLDRIDVRVPRSRVRGAARGAALGALGGVLVGLAVGGYATTQCRPGDDMCGLALIGGPMLGTMAGIPFGAIIGASSPGKRWRRVR